MFATPRIVDGIERIKNVFLEMPDPKLSSHETSQLTGVDPLMCGLILESLHDVGFLKGTGCGRYTRNAGDSV